MTKFDIFCIPFAGGSRYSFRNFQDHLPGNLNLIPLEYPGRGARIKEALLTDMDEIVNDILSQIYAESKKNPYAIYGHSMGGIVAFLVTRRIVKEGQIAPPEHLFITGTAAPSSKSANDKQRHLMGKEEFITELREMEGCPEEILQNHDLLEYYLPILRSDFQAAETFRHQKDIPLNVPITIVTGNQEDMDPQDISSWQEEAADVVRFHQLPGGHFFIMKYASRLMIMISQELSSIKTF
jgi:surfactin synthase thioesterase subunit